MLQRSDDVSELMRSARGGDATAYRRLLDALAVQLRGLVRHRLQRYGRGPEETEDIVQETLLTVHLKRHTWDESYPLEPWVRAIAHHKLIDVLRRKGVRDHIPIEDAEDTMQVAVEPDETDAIDCADLLAGLSQRQQTIVRAMAIEGHSARDVAGGLGMTEGAVRVALHRALKAMAAACGRAHP